MVFGLRERDAIDASLVVQAFGFALYVLSLFGIEIQMPLYLDITLRVTGLFLIYSLLAEFLEDELKTRVNLSPLLGIMLLVQINPVLRSYFSIDVLIRYARILNDVVLVSIFILLPVYLYASGVGLKDGLKLFLFTVVVAYPVAQLYDFFVGNIVSLLSVLYLVYALLISLRRGLSPLEALKRTIQFDDFFVGVFLDIASRMDRKFFLAYSLLLFYLLADVLLYIIPPLTGYGRQDWYISLLGLSYPVVPNGGEVLALVLAFIALAFYPLLPDRIGKRTSTMLLISPLAALFITALTINVETLVNPNAYGVVLALENVNVNISLLLATTAFLWAFLLLLRPRAGDGVVKLFPVSFMLRYTAGYALSTFIHIWTWYRGEPLYALLAGILGVSYVALGLYTTWRVVGEILANLDAPRLMVLPIGATFFPLTSGNVYSWILSSILIGAPLLALLKGFPRLGLPSYIALWVIPTYAVSIVKFPRDPAVLALLALASVVYAVVAFPQGAADLNGTVKRSNFVIVLLAGLTVAYLLRRSPAQFLPAIMVGGAFSENLVLKPSLLSAISKREGVLWSLTLAMVYSAALRASPLIGLAFLAYFLLESPCIKKCSWEGPFLVRLTLGLLAAA